MTEQLKEQINVVVEARGKAVATKARSLALYGLWQKQHQEILDAENNAKSACAEAETKLRELTLKAYAETGEKAPEVGVGIRVVPTLEYDGKEALTWGLEHKLALKLDTSGFEKMVKANPVSFGFVTITDKATATIATELVKVE